MARSVRHSSSILSDDDLYSETSTIKNYPYENEERVQSYIENEIYRREDFETNSNSDISENDLKEDASSLLSFKRIGRIDMSPEAQEKRREAYNKWLNIVNEREKERKRLEKERIDAEQRRKREEEELKKLENDEKVRLWNERKRREAQKKLSRRNELKQATEKKAKEPVKEFKKAIKFEEWVARKNEEFKKAKKEEREEDKDFKKYVKTRECTSAVSYQKWMQSSKNTPKPVPLNRGLESLRGSTTQLYVNPIPWKSTLE